MGININNKILLKGMTLDDITKALKKSDDKEKAKLIFEIFNTNKNEVNGKQVLDMTEQSTMIAWLKRIAGSDNEITDKEFKNAKKQNGEIGKLETVIDNTTGKYDLKDIKTSDLKNITTAIFGLTENNGLDIVNNGNNVSFNLGGAKYDLTISGNKIDEQNKVSKNSKTNVKYTYNDKGQKETEITTVTDNSGNVLKTTTTNYVYNGAGQLVNLKSIVKDSKGKETIIEEKRTYNDQGKITGQERKTTGPDKIKLPNGEEVFITKQANKKYEYNEAGKLSKITEFPSNPILGKTVETYYDEWGNSVKIETKENKLVFGKTNGKMDFTKIKSKQINTTVENEYDESTHKKTKSTIKTQDSFGQDSTTVYTYADGKIKTKDSEYYKRGARVVDHYEGTNIENRSGLPDKRISYESDEKTIKQITINKFDENGILIGREVQNPDGSVKETFDFTGIDGKYEYSNQIGRGDCYLLSAVNSLSQTKAGAKALKDNLEIKTDASGNKSYTMKLPGASKIIQELKKKGIPDEKIKIKSSYTFTDKELNDKAKLAGSKYSAGDKDVLLLEVVYEQFRKDVYATLKENNLKNRNVYGLSISSLERIKEGDYLSGGRPEEAAYILTGVKPAQVYSTNEATPTLYVDSDFQMHITDADGKIIEETNDLNYKIPSKMKAILDMLEKDSEDGKIDNFAAQASFKVTQQEVNGKVEEGNGHALTITKVDKDYVYMANPWEPGETVKMSKSDFAKSCYILGATPLNKDGLQQAQQTQTQIQQEEQHVQQIAINEQRVDSTSEVAEIQPVIHQSAAWKNQRLTSEQQNLLNNAKTADEALESLLNHLKIDKSKIQYNKLKQHFIQNNPSIFDKQGNIYKNADFNKLDLPKNIATLYANGKDVDNLGGTILKKKANVRLQTAK